ncbi:PH domain containing protein [Acanthamoeba castellanii str. Neff]|uniref:PH domain containing protein n=1 Tax=Acanthamoeba castellanii (strain ATCC 30010 / Neff) TaxID=1257118 RepID=L8HA36_ACACF|nr:PH domain containing protein [Acanthamoeba castellanii str. Neff]ELR22077.1 PH domain containing protein [Acanthamoeba castellanii str. Neff]
MKRQTFNPTESFLEGFLLKQGAKGLIRSFKKRWFVLVDGKLTYSRSPYSPEIGHVKMEDCTKLLAKTEGKEGSKKYIFVIQTTFGRDYTLQAASETGTQNTHASHTPDHAPPNTQNTHALHFHQS